MVVSPTVASNPASVPGLSRVVSVDCSVLKALLNVPNADTWASSEFCSFVNTLVWAAPKAVVSEDTMAEISSPDPIPVDVIKALPAAAPDVEKLPVDEIGVLIGY